MRPKGYDTIRRWRIMLSKSFDVGPPRCDMLRGLEENKLKLSRFSCSSEAPR